MTRAGVPKYRSDVTFCDWNQSQKNSAAEPLPAGSGVGVTDLPHNEHKAPEPIYSVDDSAAICKVSVDTIRRRLTEGALRRAYREGRGPRAPWRIPRGALVEAGLLEDPQQRRQSPAVPDARSGLLAEHFERIIAAKDEAIEALRELVASQEHRLALQGELLARMERELDADKPVTVTELGKVRRSG